MNVSISSIVVHAPIEEVFAFYTDVANLSKMALPEMHLRVLKAETPLRLGSRILLAMRPTLVPFEVKWSTRITEFEPNRLFQDEQIKGPFDFWTHRHEFEELAPTETRVSDRIEYGAPLGMIGRFAEQYLIAHKLEKSFQHRERFLRSVLEAQPAAR